MSKEKTKTPQIKDVEVTWYEDDIEKVQAKPNLYIQQYGVGGCNHIGREIIQNAYDECIDEHSPGSKVTVIYDRLLDKLTTKDDGRGFPETNYPLDIFCTKLQSGSKSNRSQSGGTSGEFGIGLVVTNALSTFFGIKTYRQNEKYIHSVEFEYGKKTKDVKGKNPNGLHGSEVAYIPNKKYLGKDAHIDIDEMLAWMDSLSYLFGSEKKKITTYFEEWNGLKAVRKLKIESKPFSDLLYRICKKPAISEVTTRNKGTITEYDINGKKMLKTVNIEVSFGYDLESNPNESTSIISYCNYTNTVDGGVHVDAVDETICRYLQIETKNSLTEREKEKIDILWQDVRTDLRMVINLNSDAQVQFVGNAKTKIGNKDLIPIIKDLVGAGIKEFFDKNPSVLQSYIKIVKQNAKTRIEVNKLKSVNTKPKTNQFNDHMSSNLTPCNNRGRQYKEIYLVEGQKSALGGLVDARNPDVQAVFGFRGVTANAYKNDIASIMKNAEWRAYLSAIRFDIKTQNVDDLYYNKIIISTDADSDGFGISAGICAFHARFARPIVEAGHLYKVYPPLYLLDDKKHPFARNKQEILDIYINKLISNVKVKLVAHKDVDYLDKSDMKDFIYDTDYYLEAIGAVADHYSVNRALVEIIGYNLIMYGLVKAKSDDPFAIKVNAIKGLDDQKFITKMMNEVQKKFPEIKLLHKNTVMGVIDNKFQALNITERFVDKLLFFKDTYKNYGLYVKYSEKGGIDVAGTIGDMWAAASKYAVKILDRYKGLGEANWQDLAETVMDPNKRILVQLTLDDVDKDLHTMEMLHSPSEKARDYRKKLMKNYKIQRDEIDN